MADVIVKGGARTFLDDGGRDLELARTLSGGAAPEAGAHVRLVRPPTASRRSTARSSRGASSARSRIAGASASPPPTPRTA
jgi:hypothetical protein